MKTVIFAVILLISLSFTCYAKGVTCDGLDASKQAEYLKLLDEIHPYDCCDDTVKTCLKTMPECSVVNRIAKDVCRLMKAEKTQSEIKRAMMKRGESMIAMGKPATIDLDEAMQIGDKTAPVSIVMYACLRCPFCKILVPELYSSVKNGKLKGKAKLYFKPFPIKSHKGSTEGGLAMEASAKDGKFWQFLLYAYKNFDDFKIEKLSDWAVKSGMDVKKHQEFYALTESREKLIASKKEGVRNHVEATPTLFIDGIKYVYELNIDVITDLVEEQFERKTDGK